VESAFETSFAINSSTASRSPSMASPTSAPLLGPPSLRKLAAGEIHGFQIPAMGIRSSSSERLFFTISAPEPSSSTSHDLSTAHGSRPTQTRWNLGGCEMPDNSPPAPAPGDTEWIESDVPIPEQLGPDFGARVMHPHGDDDRSPYSGCGPSIEIYQAPGGPCTSATSPG